MSLKRSSDEIYQILENLFPDARCELNYSNIFELLISVVLSSQTTDARVNMVTKKLFEAYPDSVSLAAGLQEDVLKIISPLGLAQTKSKNIILLSQVLNSNFKGVVPSSIEELITLPGVGIKTASVVLVEGFKIPAVPVDTHVFRVCQRLGISKGISVNKTMEDIKMQFKEDVLCRLHILLVYFGRYICTAKNPKCDKCPFNGECVK